MKMRTESWASVYEFQGDTDVALVVFSEGPLLDLELILLSILVVLAVDRVIGPERESAKLVRVFFFFLSL